MTGRGCAVGEGCGAVVAVEAWVEVDGEVLSRVTNSGMGVSVGLLVKGAARGTSFCFLC